MEQIKENGFLELGKHGISLYLQSGKQINEGQIKRLTFHTGQGTLGIYGNMLVTSEGRNQAKWHELTPIQIALMLQNYQNQNDALMQRIKEHEDS